MRRAVQCRLMSVCEHLQPSLRLMASHSLPRLDRVAPYDQHVERGQGCASVCGMGELHNGLRCSLAIGGRWRRGCECGCRDAMNPRESLSQGCIVQAWRKLLD